jgi:hypothetical protein
VRGILYKEETRMVKSPASAIAEAVGAPFDTAEKDREKNILTALDHILKGDKLITYSVDEMVEMIIPSVTAHLPDSPQKDEILKKLQATEELDPE